MAACWRRGTEAPSDANFCANCGAEVKAQARDLPVFAEPTTVGGEHVEAADPAPSRWLLLVALVLLGGLVGFFAIIGGDDEPSADPFDERSDFDAVDGPDSDEDDATEPDDEAVTETVELDEATIREIVAPLEWETTFVEGVGHPMAVLTIDGSDFVYSVDSSRVFSGRGTARAYRRTSDGTWEALGVVIDPDAEIGGIWEGADGALATGLDAAGNPTLWRTTDGVTWAAETLPVIDDEFGGAIPRIATEAGGVTMVLGAPRDPWTIVQDRLRELYPDDWQGLYTDFGGESSTTITVRGPFGIVVDEYEMTEFGIDPESFTAYRWERPTPTWYTTGDGWAIDTLPTPLHNVFANGDRLFGLSDDGLGPQLRVFDQGEWGEPVGFRGVWHVEPWSDRFVGTNQSQGISIFDDAGELIERVDLPGSSANGHVSATTTSDAGLVVAESIWDPNETSDRPERIVVLRDGYTLEVDGDLTISRGDEIVLRSSLFWQGDASRYRVEGDADELSITFLSEDGDPMVAFTIAELMELERASYGYYSSNDRMRVVFTADLESWYGGDLANDDYWFISPRLTDDRIIATQLEVPDSPWAAEAEGQRFIIIAAPLPE